MYVKKRMSLLLFAALAMVLFTACGRWDFSREAAKAANEAQGETLRVEFTVEQKFTNALRAALEENIQPADVEKAMRADESIEPFLTSGYRLDVYPLRADISAKDAAKQLAAEFVNRLAGCEDKGYISMVKADNGYFYETVLTYRHSSSGGSSGGASGGDNDPDTPVVPDEPESFTVTAEVTSSYSGKAGISPSEVSNLSKGSDVNFTVSRSFFDKLASVKINSEEIFDTDSPNEDLFNVAYNNNFTYSFTLKNVQADTRIEVEFERAEAVINQLYITEGKKEYALGETISKKGMKLHGPLNNSNKWGDTGDDITIDLDLDVNGDVTITPETMGIDTEVVTVHYKGQIGSADVECDIKYPVTLIPTVSDYGESKYLSKEDFDTLVKSFNDAVETLGKEVSSGADDLIQQAMNKAEAANIDSALYQLESGKVSGWTYLAKAIANKEDSVETFQKNITGKLMYYYGSDQLMSHIYMTIKDGANGQIECYIYTVDVVDLSYT